MLNSTVLEVTIGLVVCYACVSLLASSVYEALATLAKMRANSLLQGVKALLNDPTLSGLARDVYNHALVNPTSAGKTPVGQEPAVKPSYIDSKHLAMALIDAVQKGSTDWTQLKDKIDALPDDQLRGLLQGMYARAEDKVENLQKAVAGWFDAAMERLSGGYKRRAQLWTFVIALVIAGLLNVDSIHLFRSLWTHPAALALSAVPGTADAALATLNELPIGWQPFPPSVFGAVCGWIITAVSVLFGAPFWFDLLQRMVNLRGTGKKPDEQTEKAAARG